MVFRRSCTLEALPRSGRSGAAMAATPAVTRSAAAIATEMRECV